MYQGIMSKIPTDSKLVKNLSSRPYHADILQIDEELSMIPLFEQKISDWIERFDYQRTFFE